MLLTEFYDHLEFGRWGGQDSICLPKEQFVLTEHFLQADILEGQPHLSTL